MRSLRRRLSNRLLEEGATIALEREQIRRGIERSGPAHGSAEAFPVLQLLGWVSSAAIRLGMVLMPRVDPDFLAPRVLRR
jgi:hypothetical protein